MDPTARNPAIVVAAYNRKRALLRLLESLEQAEYPASPVTLVISIDKSDTQDVAHAAEEFKWTHGEKKIIQHPERLGLRKHILSCGDLTKEYGSIILFEDDLLASKYFYSFAAASLRFYHDDTRIAGISLYSYDISESGFNPFAAVDDGNDVYFMQVASSWGQAWTSGQWKAFREWYSGNPEISESEMPPAYLLQWSDNSWKKHYIRYLHFTEKYFVFPRQSLSTNFEEPGSSTKTKGLYQVPLLQGKRDFRSISTGESRSLYDAYFEMTAACLKKWNAQLAPFDFTTDISGLLPTAYCKTPYLLTSKAVKEAKFSFGMEMFPPVLNVINNVQGGTIKLARREDVLGDKIPNDLSYYKYTPVSEIIFQEQLIERIEAVHKINNGKTDELHKEYIAKLDALHGEIRELNKTYHDQINALHTEYEQKIKDSVERALKDYQFNLDHPLFAVVTIAKQENREAALQTARSVQQQNYPRVRHKLIIIGNAEGLDLAEFSPESFSLQCVSEAAEALNAAEAHLNKGDSDIHCWLEAGTVLLPKSMETVRSIFMRFVEVNWLKGLPGRLGNNSEIIPDSNGVDFRWDKNRFHASTLAETGNKISRAGIFWKKHLWQKTGANFNKSYPHLADIELFHRMYQVDLLHTVMAYLASAGNGTYSPSAAAEKEFSALQKNFPQRGGIQAAVSALSYPLFNRDIPVLRAIHRSRNAYPPLIRFDYNSQSFYLSEY